MNWWTKIIVISALMAVLTIVACGESVGEPTFQPIPTPTTPPGFIQCTDELSSFSIDYPKEWQLGISQMSRIEGELKEFALGKSEYLSEFAFIFVAFDANVEHGVSIAVESLPFQMSVEEYSEGSAKTIHEFYPSLQVQRVSKVDVGGKEAIFDEVTFEASGLGTGLTGLLAQTQLTFIHGKAAWVVTCDYPADSDFAETCESIIRTVRILE